MTHFIVIILIAKKGNYTLNAFSVQRSIGQFNPFMLANIYIYNVIRTEQQKDWHLNDESYLISSDSDSLLMTLFAPNSQLLSREFMMNR